MIISNNGKVTIGEYELPIIDFSMDISYAPFTEYGRLYPTGKSGHIILEDDCPDPHVIDSTATVIDPEVLLLPAPGQKDVVENDLQG